MTGKRRSIKDVDNDLAKMSINIAAITDAVCKLVDKANEPAPEPKKSAAEKAHEAEFGEYSKQERQETAAPETMILPAFEMPAYIGQWIVDVSKYHERSVEQEVQLMIKKLYFSSKASMEAEMSRTTTLSGAGKG